MFVTDILTWICIALGIYGGGTVLHRLTIGRNSADMRKPGARSMQWLWLSLMVVPVATVVLPHEWLPWWLLTIVATANLVWGLRVLRSGQGGGKSAGQTAERP
jgi:hypothetical protein